MAIKLTPEEHEEIKTLVQSPVYRTLQKLGEQYKAVIMNQLLTAEDPNKLFQLQGRVIGVNAMQNLPGVVQSIKDHEDKVKAERAEQDTKKRRATREKQN